MQKLRLLLCLFVWPALVACSASPRFNPSFTRDEQDHPATANGLRYLDYEVMFTNPTCADYKYGPDQHVVSSDGQPLTQKPKNVFCTQADSAASGDRPEAPQRKLLGWINDPGTKEVFFTYLSFSNHVVKDALCKGIQERNLKVTFVIDNTSDVSTANSLLACAPGNGDSAFKPQMFLRGHEGGIGYAHNKVFLINPNEGQVRLAFSSGNMTSGIVLHHENWHFITPERDTHFVQAHLCMMKGELEHHASTSEYKAFIQSCRAGIPYPEESDIKVFFVPGEGPRATQFLISAIKASSQIRLAAHRFGYNKLIAALKSELQTETPPELQMVFDDDVWWAGHGDQTGDNEAWEYDNVASLQGVGGQARWMETNQAQHLLHHNKYLVLNTPAGSELRSAVFGGAGNLTGTGFTSNFENFYYVEIPAVIDAYNKQYDHVWNDLATPTEKLPSTDVLPPGSGG